MQGSWFRPGGFQRAESLPGAGGEVPPQTDPLTPLKTISQLLHVWLLFSLPLLESIKLKKNPAVCNQIMFCRSGPAPTALEWAGQEPFGVWQWGEQGAVARRPEPEGAKCFQLLHCKRYGIPGLRAAQSEVAQPIR